MTTGRAGSDLDDVRPGPLAECHSRIRGRPGEAVVVGALAPVPVDVAVRPESANPRPGLAHKLEVAAHAEAVVGGGHPALHALLGNRPRPTHRPRHRRWNRTASAGGLRERQGENRQDGSRKQPRRPPLDTH